MEKMNISLIAVNKFFYYAQNYPSIRIEYPTISGNWEVDYLPDFFKVFPPIMIEHFRSKWLNAVDRTDSYGYLMKFYAELDGTYRQMLIKYIMENYNDECKIPLLKE